MYGGDGKEEHLPVGILWGKNRGLGKKTILLTLEKKGRGWFRAPTLSAVTCSQETTCNL